MILSSDINVFLLVTLVAVLNVEATPRRHPLIPKLTLPSMKDWRIIGGEENNGDPVPFMARVLVNGFHECGSAILNERTVLTAAHCFDYLRPNDVVQFHVGDNNRTVKEGEIVDTVAIHQHPKYNIRTNNYDVAIVRLKETLDYNERVQPIKLIKPDTEYEYGSIATVYGWGDITDGLKINSEVLKFARVPLVESEVCNKLLGPNIPITEDFLCAGVVAGGDDACKGDSGGPLVQNNRVIGLVSWGHGCGRPNTVGVYTDVKCMLPWIKETLDREYGESL